MIAGGILHRIVARPIGACVLAIAVAVLGMLAWQRLQVSLLPAVESPIITVRADRAGASAMELEEHLLMPLQDLLATLPGLVAMQGRAAAERVEVQLALAADADVSLSIERLRDRLASWRRPRGVSEPRILRYDPGAEPLLRLILRERPGGPDLSALALAVRDDLLPRLEGRPAVASALLRGSSEYELRIRPDALALRAAGLTTNDLAQAIRDGVEQRSVGSIRTSDGNRQINLRGPATLPEHLPQLPLAGGRRLGDVASMEWLRAEQDERTVAIAAGTIGDALLIEVLMQAQAAVVAAADDVRASLDSIARPNGPGSWDFAGGELLLLADRADPIRTALQEVIQAMIIGSCLAGLVLLLFLRSLWSAVVVFLAVPLSVAGAFLVLSQVGVGINLMSLGGLALGIGMLVDNAIVVIESARRRMNPGMNQRQRQAQVAHGTGEVASAVVAATATTMAVFLPLLFAPGILGDLLGDLAWAVAASLAASLAVALLVTPPLLALGNRDLHAAGRALPSVHAGYGHDIATPWRHPGWWLLSFLPWTVLIALPWAPPLWWLLVAGCAIWLVLASWWLFRLRIQHPETLGILRWLVGLPAAWAHLALCWLRWWLVCLCCLPLILLRPLRWAARSLGWLWNPLDRSLQGIGGGIAGRYQTLLRLLIARPILGLALMVAIALLGAWSAPYLPLRLLPESTHQRFLLDVQLPRGSSVDDGAQWGATFLSAMAHNEPGLSGVAIAGEDDRFAPTLDRRQAHQLRIFITRSQRERHSADEHRWLAAIEQQAITHGALSAAAWPPPLFSLAANENSAFAIALAGGDSAALREAAQHWQAGLRLLGARGVRSSANDEAIEIVVSARSRQLQEAGLSWQDLQNRLLAATDLISVESFRPRFDGLTPSPTILPIRVYGPLRDAQVSALTDIDVGTLERPLPLSAVASIERIPSSGIIRHRDGLRVATLEATALPQGMGSAAAIAALGERHPLPAGMEVLSYGLDTISDDHFMALLGLLLLAVFLVLVVMAVQFEDLAQPFLVVLAVPMAVAGALPTLFLTGYGIDTMSGIGLVVLAGIAVNNAIVLVTTANLRRDQGMPSATAIFTAGGERLRPIAMTTLTTVLALLPLAIGWGEAAELRAPLAVAVIGGMASSTVLILLALPSVMALSARRSPRSPVEAAR